MSFSKKMQEINNEKMKDIRNQQRRTAREDELHQIALKELGRDE